ncbi:MAG: serine/threonine protein kinase, partial [Deltaproteobacteria bacterium]|nr:serine/threonine protein kinase [Deltaproteobacteria bacterium]
MGLFTVALEEAKTLFPEYTFVSALTPSAQKAAFHVRDKSGRDLCLKIISPDYDVDRLQREILALQSISHANVATMVEYTFSSTQGSSRHFIVEEFIEGDDLSVLFESKIAWPRKTVCQFFASLCSGLNALRAAGIVHRDLKPSNIRVRQQVIPVVIDFGLARHLNLPDLTRTQDGAQIGTPNYFAPEQVLGTKREIDHRTDLFALGIMLFQALTGRHPFLQEGASLTQICENICTS